MQQPVDTDALRGRGSGVLAAGLSPLAPSRNAAGHGGLTLGLDRGERALDGLGVPVRHGPKPWEAVGRPPLGRLGVDGGSRRAGLQIIEIQLDAFDVLRHGVLEGASPRRLRDSCAIPGAWSEVACHAFELYAGCSQRWS